MRSSILLWSEPRVDPKNLFGWALDRQLLGGVLWVTDMDSSIYVKD